LYSSYVYSGNQFDESVAVNVFDGMPLRSTRNGGNNRHSLYYVSYMKIQRPTNFIREFPFHDVEPVKKILSKHTGEYSGEYPFHIYRKLIFFLNKKESYRNLIHLSLIGNTWIRCGNLNFPCSLPKNKWREKGTNNSLIETSFRPTVSRSIWLRPRPSLENIRWHFNMTFRMQVITRFFFALRFWRVFFNSFHHYFWTKKLSLQVDNKWQFNLWWWEKWFTQTQKNRNDF
jgi:hypothetical protein